MTLLVATIPLMIAVIAAVLAPLVAAMRHEHALQDAALADDSIEIVRCAAHHDSRAA